jgi:nicotinate-nucleotide adenylyltransferase
VRFHGRGISVILLNAGSRLDVRIGFFGGSFDPPHRGHLVAALAAAATFSLERVLLAPTGRQPLKPGGAVASFAERLEMVRLLCEGQRGLEASDVDAPLHVNTPAGAGGANFTVDTLARLRQGLGPDDVLFNIVGVDAFLGLREWKDPERLLELAEWIVVTRSGFPLERVGELGLSPEQVERVHILDGVAEAVSATQVRASLSRGEADEKLVPKAVLRYIHARHLYGT